MSEFFFSPSIEGPSATPSRPGNGTVGGDLELPSSEVC